ncbi:MAG: regulatory iron-sulfur-containing complex subunit RicT [Planctomycetota bacterium]
MPIHPLPQFEEDLDTLRIERNAEKLREAGASDSEIERLSADDRAVYKRLKAPKTLVVRFGVMKLVGEFPYEGETVPGCGSKLVVRTHRGVEIGEMLTSTCPNSGCSKSVSRKEMLQYIDNSGGRQYPFRTDGKVLRIATGEDLDEQARLEQSRHGIRTTAKKLAERLLPHAKIVDAEPIIGGERLTIYFTSEDRLETRELHAALQAEFHIRVDLRHVGARDEARITADYERCGQYCCCKNFLKVLKPISMRSAKVQKATLDPLKISGRCGRLMCCLRYEDETYEELRKRLPRRKSKVGTPEGDGIVVDTQILTQLALVELDDTRERVAIPVEELTEPGLAPKRKPKPVEEPRRDESDDRPRRKKKRRRKKAEGDASSAGTPDAATPEAAPEITAEPDAPAKKKRRKRRRKKPADGSESGNEQPREDAQPKPPAGESSDAAPKKKRRRRRRRRSSDGEGGGSDSESEG